ncbi:hypothetical protein VHEMI03729 [[Torrubiella] hemipterigena]|uniref:HIG1 domain-containing protein n=1 Tax=[Torrubiella] hemipterigena TaxID=1531966 RepID=A0A0A1TBR4_9HYPO|nr:hypothetical protein VHEMI03729 [[Torrubiella] hemipterigena]
MGLTTFAFISAYRAIRRGDSHQANRMFRARVAAQGFTVVAMVAGSMYYSKDRQKTKELRKLNDEHDAEVKRQKWIRELEARDEEDQALRARLQKRMEEKAKGEQAAATTNGGILGRMGLWSQEDKSAAAEKKSAEPVEEEKKAKKNPKSSLGAIGEVMSTKKKEDESGK